MTPSWGILPHVTHGFFDDEYEPLAPIADVSDASSLPKSRPAGLAEGLVDDDEDLSGDHGVSGGDGIVRIWLDDDHRLAKVRVSPVWYERLQGEETLEDAFHQAFRRAWLDVGATEDPEGPVTDEAWLAGLPRPTPTTTRAALAAVHEQLGRWRDVAARVTATPAARPRPTVGRADGVRLTLDDWGHPRTIAFDQDWLDDAQVGVIVSSVMAAASRAYEQYVPSTDARQVVRHRYRGEYRLLRAGVHRMYNAKGRA